jgi:dolichyl-phosphate-mannose--protein O-mannosyl transferase
MRIVKFLFFAMLVLALGEPAAAWFVDRLHLPTRLGGVVILIMLVALMVAIWRWLAPTTNSNA